MASVSPMVEHFASVLREHGHHAQSARALSPLERVELLAPGGWSDELEAAFLESLKLLDDVETFPSNMRLYVEARRNAGGDVLMGTVFLAGEVVFSLGVSALDYTGTLQDHAEHTARAFAKRVHDKLVS